MAGFGLVKAAGGADVLQATSTTGPLAVEVIGQSALYAAEACIVFGFASVAIEVRGIIAMDAARCYPAIMPGLQDCKQRPWKVCSLLALVGKQAHRLAGCRCCQVLCCNCCQVPCCSCRGTNSTHV